MRQNENRSFETALGVGGADQGARNVFYGLSHVRFGPGTTIPGKVDTLRGCRRNPESGKDGGGTGWQTNAIITFRISPAKFHWREST